MKTWWLCAIRPVVALALASSAVAYAGDVSATAGAGRLASGAACAPITIVEGGRYTGCYRSTDPNVAAVTVATDAPVTIAGALIQHAGDGVTSSEAGTQLRIVDSRLVALDPHTAAPVSQRAVSVDQPASFVVEHNSFAKGQGIWMAGYTEHPVAPLRIRFNRSVDVGRFGHPDRPNCCVQFVQFDNVEAAADISWNHTTNRSGRSSIEDNINLYESSGVDVDHPIDVHDNLIDGAYPERGKGRDYTGGGIMLADGGGAYETARRNRVISTTNYGIAIVGGHDNHIAHNWMVSDGRTDRREVVGPEYGVGIAVWDAGETGVMADVDASGNHVGWERGTDLTRNDWWLPACEPAEACRANRAYDEVIPAKSEERQRHAWQRALVRAGHTIGPRT